MSNPLRGELTIKLGADQFNCKLNFDSIVRIETALDVSIIQLASRISEANLKITELSYILFTAIKGGGNDITEKQVNNLIWSAGMVDAVRCVGEIISMALSTGDDSEKKS